MYNAPVNAQQTENFTFRSSWYSAINRIRSKTLRRRIFNYVLEYAFTHQFVLTGNATIDSLMIVIIGQIDQELGCESGIIEPEPTVEEIVDVTTATTEGKGTVEETTDSSSNRDTNNSSSPTPYDPYLRDTRILDSHQYGNMINIHKPKYREKIPPRL